MHIFHKYTEWIRLDLFVKYKKCKICDKKKIKFLDRDEWITAPDWDLLVKKHEENINNLTQKAKDRIDEYDST